MHCMGEAGVRHHFHGRCLAAWVAECLRGARPPSCPNCRGPVEVHTERLASQLGAGVPVREFLTQHMAHVEHEEPSQGWVQVGAPQQIGIVEQLRLRFERLDTASMSQRMHTSGPLTRLPLVSRSLAPPEIEQDSDTRIAPVRVPSENQNTRLGALGFGWFSGVRGPTQLAHASSSSQLVSRGHDSADNNVRIVPTSVVTDPVEDDVADLSGRPGVDMLLVPRWSHSAGSSAVGGGLLLHDGMQHASLVSSQAVVAPLSSTALALLSSSAPLEDDPIEESEGARIAPRESPLGSTSFELPDWAASWPYRRPVDLNAIAMRSEHAVGPVTVSFPFEEIFPPQIEIIESTVQSVLHGRHSVIESPTGTGKTMSLLCGALAAQRYLAEQFGQAPRIIFCTRTHSQIKQVVKEARNSPYRPWLQIVGSREQGLCSEPDVLQQARDDHSKSSQVCKEARKKAEIRRRRGDSGAMWPEQADATPACRVWTSAGDESVVEQAHRAMRAGAGVMQRPSQGMMDIEDLGALGRELTACPYFLSRAALPAAELVVCPYNYVLEPAIARGTGLLDNRSIVIIDEGHNLEAHCCEAGTVCLSEASLREIQQRVQQADQYLTDFRGGEGAENVTEVLETVHAIHSLCSRALATFVRGFAFQSHEDRLPCKTWNSTLERGPVVTDFIEACNVQPSFAGAVQHLEEVVEGRGQPGGSRIAGLAIQVVRALGDLKRFAEALEGCSARPTQYKVHLEAVRTSPASSQASQTSAEINARGARADWSFELTVLLVSPEAVFETLAESAHCVIIASGTLAPAAWFAAELGAAFSGRLLQSSPVQAPHIIDPSQLGVIFVGRSRRGVELRCVREQMLQRPFAWELGHTLLEIVSSIPGGVLVFLPSRNILEAVVRLWQESSPGGHTSLWSAIAAQKSHLVVEDGGADARGSLARHQEAVLRHGSSVLFGVYRGRSSEGISLNDDSVRGVVCIGIPLAPPRPDVLLRREYRNALARAAPVAPTLQGAPMKLDGEAWYSLHAHRAVNQALGRVIRHRRDFGACVLVDARWTSKGSVRAAKYLPLWLRRLTGLRDNMRGESLDFPLDRLVADLRNHFAGRQASRGTGNAEPSDADATAAPGAVLASAVPVGEGPEEVEEAELEAEEHRRVRPRLALV